MTRDPGDGHGNSLGGVHCGFAVIFAVVGVAIQSLLEPAAVSAPLAGLFGATTGNDPGEPVRIPAPDKIVGRRDSPDLRPNPLRRRLFP